MQRQSKYNKDPQELYSMSIPELKTYIRGAYKTMQKKVSRTRKSEFADFSELLNELEEVEGRIGTLSGGTRGLTEKQIREKAFGLSLLFRITETPAQLEREGFDNIKNFFREPRFTRRFIEGIHRNKTILRKLANKNDKFIRDILGSEQVRSIVEEAESAEEGYRKLLLATSDTLDLYDEDEKEQIVNDEWNPVFEYQGDSQWLDPETNELIDVFTEWKWEE